MNRRSLQIVTLTAGVLSSGAVNAWFFFIPTGAIQRAMEIDPDSIVVSQGDRAIGQCAGYHLNQAQKGMSPATTREPSSVGMPTQQTAPTQTPESKFHSDMADVALQRSSEKDKVKSLAEAYSVRWGRVASADRQANLQYGANLARGCVSNDIPLRFAAYPAWQTQQEEKKRQQAEEERKRAEAIEVEKTRARAEEAAKAESKAAPIAASSSNVDYVAEARKSARILGCSASDVKVTGAENNNILMAANCGTGQVLQLTCDQSGLCLRR
jgi:hypothetical protein